MKVECPSFFLLFSNAVQFDNCLLNAYYVFAYCVWVPLQALVTWGSYLRCTSFWLPAFPAARKWMALILYLLIQIHFLNGFFWDLNAEPLPLPCIHTVSQATCPLLFSLGLFSTEQPEFQLLAFLKLRNPHSLDKSSRYRLVSIYSVNFLKPWVRVQKSSLYL